MSNAVTNRKQEIGIRIALGARSEEVMRYILLGLTGFCACLIPAKRVIKVNPIQALRVE